jgi:hypothetical protein
VQPTTRSGFWRETDGSRVPAVEAYKAWGEAAYPTLIAIARDYHAVITYGELGKKVQADTDIHTTQQLNYWIGKVLRHVVLEAHRRGGPPLTALAVDAEGRVGDGYKLVLETAGEAAIEDDLAREEHAALARLRCYQRYCPSMPADGGTPALAPKLEAKVLRKARAVEPAPPICPACFLALPVSGVCDNCG